MTNGKLREEFYMSHTHTNIHKTNNESEHGIFFFKNKCICTHQSSKNFNTVLEVCHNLGICPSENAQKISLWVKIHNKLQDGLQSADYPEFNNVMDWSFKYDN